MDKKIREFLASYLPSLSDATILELGANDGTDTAAMMALLQLPFRFYAFEPDARHHPTLSALADNHPGLTVLGHAIGDRNGEVDFYVSSGPDGTGRDSSSIKKPTGHLERWPQIKFNPGRVRMMTLDTFAFVHRVHSVDFIWADIQGAELEMIWGGLNLLAHTRYLYTECYMRVGLYRGQPSLQDILSVLPGKWNLVFRTATDVLLERQG